MQLSNTVTGMHGVFADMNTAIEKAKEAQKHVRVMSMDQRERIIGRIRTKIKENAEIMARIRKYPAISYLVISIFPLIPGAGVYYTTNHLINGDMVSFAAQGKHTIAIAGVIAVGILMISSLVKLTGKWHLRKH